jgi:hypothetical protein
VRSRPHGHRLPGGLPSWSPGGRSGAPLNRRSVWSNTLSDWGGYRYAVPQTANSSSLIDAVENSRPVPKRFANQQRSGSLRRQPHHHLTGSANCEIAIVGDREVKTPLHVGALIPQVPRDESHREVCADHRDIPLTPQ